MPILALTVMTGCARMVGGTALAPVAPSITTPAVDVGRIMLDPSRVRALLGADEQLTVIPTMDSATPVDLEDLAAAVPEPCRFTVADTAVFGTSFTHFHKTTYQYPPKAALLSQAAALYPDPESARRALDALVSKVSACAKSSAGPDLVTDWSADDGFVHTRAATCGRAYQIKSAVLLEVTYCGFTESDANLIVANMAHAIPD